MGQLHWVHCEKGPAEAVLPSPAEDVQPAKGAVDTVLLCHHWIHLLHINNCLVQLSYQIWPQKTTEGSPDSWANHWYNPLSRNCTHPEWAKGLKKITLDPHIQHTPSLNCYRLVDATELWVPEKPDTETVSSLRQSISWTLDIKRRTHNTIIHYLFITRTYFFISNLHISDLYTHNCLYHILCLCYFIHCLFVYCSFIICVLSCCCHSVAQWSFCHYNKFLICVNIPGQ